MENASLPVFTGLFVAAVVSHVIHEDGSVLLSLQKFGTDVVKAAQQRTTVLMLGEVKGHSPQIASHPKGA